jgi:HAE1 family hydrophobic/amphiphilic exporter-1
MSRLSAFAVSKRSVTLLLAAALFVAGISAWGSLQQELLPDIQFPVLTVIAPYPGASASDVAEQVTKPIERAISGTARLQQIQSTSANSVSLVIASFSYGTSIKDARQQVEANLADVGLPQSVTPKVTALNINESPVVVASVQVQGKGLQEAALAAQSQIVPALIGLDGVSSVDITGGLEPRLFVTLEPSQLTLMGISLQQVTGVLAASNLTLPVGQVPSDGSRIPVSATHSLASVDEIEHLIVGVRTTAAPATPVRILDIGRVEVVDVPTTGYSRLDGAPALSISVSKSSGANTVSVADAVQAEFAKLQADNPGLKITTVSDLSSFIKESRDGLVREGGLGAVFAIVTIFLFLFSLRSTLVAAMSIPLSILTALTIMLVTGVTINIMTLGGLAVAVGRVVDDAIVVLENIYRHRARGEDRLTAVLAGPREVAGAITASTATTVMVFLPLGFVGGLVSQFFLPFALTVTFALLASLVCALTVVPVLAYLLVDRVNVAVDETGEPKRSIWVRVYTPTIRFVLRNRRTKWSVVGLALVLVVGAMSLVPLIPTAFINAGSEKVLLVSLAPPPGTGSAAVLERTTEAEKILQADPKVTQIESSVPGEADTGSQALSAAFSGRPSNSAVLYVRLTSDTSLTEYQRKFTDALAPVNAGGWTASVSEATGFSGGGINVIVSGEDPAKVASTTQAVVASMQKLPDLINVKSDLAVAAKTVEVVVDPNKAIGAGLTTAQVANEVRSVLAPTPVGRVQFEGQAPIGLYVRIDPVAIDSVDALRRMPVGASVPINLGSVADVQEVDSQGSITRIDEAPASSISAEITSKDTGAVSTAVSKEIQALKDAGLVPAGITVRLAGVTQQQNEAFGSLFASMGVAILLVYVMMVLTFNSLVTPFVILFSLPLATIGAFPALVLTGRPIGISALIGFLMLIGIVVTNAIVLLDLVERLRREGHPTTEALVEGGRTRVRPILMTAIATILALIPLAAGFNEGSIIASELGTVVIGGLFSSTFLTLILIPVIYSLVDGARMGVNSRLAIAATPPAVPSAGSASSSAPPA